jgi:hypothetical protein
MTKIRPTVLARIADRKTFRSVATIAVAMLFVSAQAMLAGQPSSVASMNSQTVVAANAATTTPPTGSGPVKSGTVHPCTRVCVKSTPPNKASPGECLQWKIVC